MSTEVDEQVVRAAPTPTTQRAASPGVVDDAGAGGARRRTAEGPTGAGRTSLPADWVWECDPSDREVPQQEEPSGVDRFGPLIRAIFLGRMGG